MPRRKKKRALSLSLPLSPSLSILFSFLFEEGNEISANGLQNETGNEKRKRKGKDDGKGFFFLLPCFARSPPSSYLSSLSSSLPFSLSCRLLLLVVDRERDDAAAAADHADGREAPLELAVGHLC